MPNFLAIAINYTTLNQAKSGVLHYSEHANHYEIVDSSRSISIWLAKRTDYPRTYCRLITDGTQVQLGYGDESENQEYLSITISVDGNVEIRRDARITLPLFYSYSKVAFTLNNDYARVVHSLTASTLCTPHMVEQLMPGSPRQNRTLLQEVKWLGERQKLRVSRDGLSIQYPAARSWVNSLDAPVTNPADYLPLLEATLTTFIDTYLQTDRTAFQVSGGLDSSTLPQFMSQRTKAAAVLAHIGFPSQLQQQHYEKVRLLSEATAYPIALTAFEYSDSPFYDLLNLQTPYLFHVPGEMMHVGGLSKQALSLQQNGNTVLVTGLGSDDISENIIQPEVQYAYGDDERVRRENVVLPPYLTNRFSEQYIEQTPAQLETPLAVLPLPTLAATLAANNPYIECGLWPVSPFINPELYAYCQGLPAHFRANKNILRAYHEVRQFVKEIYVPTKQEEMSYIELTLCDPEYKALVHRIAKQAVTVELGYVDINKLLQLIDHADGNNPESLPWLWHIWIWLETEVSLQATRLQTSMRIS